MSENLKQKVEEMKQLTIELLKGRQWEDYAGYSLNDELLPFMTLTEELEIG